ncbi:MAG: alpha/beta hydrolase, partial [Patescibacteria group bacterium]
MIIFAAVLLIKLFLIQVVHGNAYSEAANHQYATPAINIYERGTIYFERKDGQLVSAATQISGFKMAIDATKIIDAENIYQKLSKITSLNHDDFIITAEKKSDTYKEIANRLSKEEFTIFAMDAPGHGLSQGNFLNLPHYSGLIEQFIYEQKKLHAILTHSFGGFASVYTMHRLPHLPVSKMVVMAAPGEVAYFIDYYQQVLGLSTRAIH